MPADSEAEDSAALSGLLAVAGRVLRVRRVRWVPPVGSAPVHRAPPNTTRTEVSLGGTGGAGFLFHRWCVLRRLSCSAARPRYSLISRRAGPCRASPASPPARSSNFQTRTLLLLSPPFPIGCPSSPSRQRHGKHAASTGRGRTAPGGGLEWRCAPRQRGSRDDATASLASPAPPRPAQARRRDSAWRHGGTMVAPRWRSASRGRPRFRFGSAKPNCHPGLHEYAGCHET